MGNAGEIILLGATSRIAPLLREKLLPLFTRRTGYTVVPVPGSSTETLARLQASRNGGAADVALLDDGAFQQAIMLGLLQPNDPLIVTTEADLYPLAQHPGHVGISLGLLAVAILYDRSALERANVGPPSSWLTLGDPKYQGKGSIASITTTDGLAALVQFARISGGDEKNLAPGFQVIKERILPRVATVTRTSDVPSQLRQQIAWLGIGNQAIGNQAAARGQAIAIAYPDDGVPFYQAHAAAASAARNVKGAMALVDFLGSAEAQALLAQHAFYAPANPQAQLSDAVAQRVPHGEAALRKLAPINWDAVNERRAEWAKLWMQEIEVK